MRLTDELDALPLDLQVGVLRIKLHTISRIQEIIRQILRRAPNQSVSHGVASDNDPLLLWNDATDPFGFQFSTSMQLSPKSGKSLFDAGSLSSRGTTLFDAQSSRSSASPLFDTWSVRSSPSTLFDAPPTRSNGISLLDDRSTRSSDKFIVLESNYASKFQTHQDAQFGIFPNAEPPILEPGKQLLPKTCTNCFTQTTPLWRQNPEGQPLCNACGLFLILYGVVRPLSLKTDVIKKRNRGFGRLSAPSPDKKIKTPDSTDLSITNANTGQMLRYMEDIRGHREPGRPRKRFQLLSTTLSERSDGRNKTGCIICYRRKKLCDETKPACEFLQPQRSTAAGY